MTESEEVRFFGHPLVSAEHATTIEVTTDERLTSRGDCIIGVRADKGLASLSEAVRRALRSDGSRVRVTIEVSGESFVVNASGDARLPLECTTEMVIRRSEFVCRRTLAVRADAASADIPRRMVEKLRSPTCRGVLRIEVDR